MNRDSNSKPETSTVNATETSERQTLLLSNLERCCNSGVKFTFLFVLPNATVTREDELTRTISPSALDPSQALNKLGIVVHTKYLSPQEVKAEGSEDHGQPC